MDESIVFAPRSTNPPSDSQILHPFHPMNHPSMVFKPKENLYPNENIVSQIISNRFFNNVPIGFIIDQIILLLRSAIGGSLTLTGLDALLTQLGLFTNTSSPSPSSSTTLSSSIKNVTSTIILKIEEFIKSITADEKAETKSDTPAESKKPETKSDTPAESKKPETKSNTPVESKKPEIKSKNK
jgi:hypothetical protein